MKFKTIFAFALLVAATFPGVAFGDALYLVSIDTAPLMVNPGGPFWLDFQFTDGSGSDDGNNSVTLDSFSFGSGGPIGSPSTFGNVVGDLTTSVVMTDSSFFNEFTQSFTPGAALNFRVGLTGNVDLGGVPDQFSLAILDSSGYQIPTLGPFDTLLLANFDSEHPTLLGFASDTSRNLTATGEPITLASPEISGVPEPSLGWLLMGASLAMIALPALARRKRLD